MPDSVGRSGRAWLELNLVRDVKKVFYRYINQQREFNVWPPDEQEQQVNNIICGDEVLNNIFALVFTGSLFLHTS